MKLFYRRNHSRTYIVSILLLFLFCASAGFAQTVLNGDFENNTSPGNTINNTNAAYDGYMANSIAFGSYGDMDIITTAMYCGLAESGSWFVAFTGGGTDAISLTLSAPLVQGNTYSISFWDRGCTGWTPEPFQFGLSTADSVFGTTIYTSSFTPVDGTWSQRTFTFTAPNNGQYLTMQTLGALSNWTQLDNVQFVNAGPPVISNFLASDSVLCQNDCISFTDLSTNNPTSWQWTFAGAFPPTSTDKNPSSVCYTDSGTFAVTLHAYNAGGGDTLTVTNYITVSAAPPTPTIVQYEDTLLFTGSPSYVSYQWYDSTAVIPGATDTFLVVINPGNYNVQVTNASGCKIAVGINVVLGMGSFNNDEVISLYPDPVGNNLQLAIGNWQSANLQVQIYNVLGEVVQQSAICNPQSVISIDVTSLSAGIYFLQLRTVSGMVERKFVKE